MKANEAPEKLYMNWVNYPLEEMQVEYTRTDAFIKKAVDWLEDNAIEYWGTESVDNGMMIDDYKKAMKL